MEYAKIETLFERDPVTRFVDPTKLRNPAYGLLKRWHWTEKVDGTNIRCIWTPSLVGSVPQLEFRGRTDNAQLHGDLYKRLYQLFDPCTLLTVFPGTPVILYGEGYGPGIQKGGGYRKDKSFILFDVLVAGKYWLNDENMRDVAAKLGIDAVPSFGLLELETAVAFVKSGFISVLPGASCQAEGLIGKPEVPLFDQRGHRLIVKLKHRDFERN